MRRVKTAISPSLANEGRGRKSIEAADAFLAPGKPIISGAPTGNAGFPFKIQTGFPL
jgi:hypothetical protein